MKAIAARIALGSLALSFALVACPTPVQTPTPPAPPPAAISRIVLETRSVLLENVGATQQLVARALDAQGNPVAASLSWESSKPGNVSVDANGLARGVALGSSQLRAVAGGFKSAPILAAVGALQDGVVRIGSDKIVSGPSFPDGVAPFSVGSTYTAVLKDVSPTVGKLWFSKSPDGTPVEGKVVSSAPVAGGTEVTLEIVPLGDIFKALSADEEIQIPSEEIVVPEALQQNYTVEKLPDGSLNFTPRSASSLLHPLAFDVGPFRCSGSLPPTTLTLGNPSLNLNLGNPSFQFVFDVPVPFVTAGRLKLFFSASPSLRINSGTHTINSNFNNQNLSCKYKPGISVDFSLFGVGLTAKLTPGLKVGGSFGAGSLSFSARLSAATTVRLGFDCRPPAGCTNLTTGNTGTVQGGMRISSLGNLAATIRDLKLGAFADVALSADTPIGSLVLYDVNNGLDMSFDFAPLTTQIAENNPADYGLERYLTVDPFAAIKSFVSFFLGSGAANSLGLDPITVTLAAMRSPLITSATVTSQTVQGVTLNAQLDSNRIHFFNTISPFGLLYNVARLRLIGVRANGTLETISEVTPASGATSVNLSAPLQVWNGFADHYVSVIPVVLDGLPVGTRRVQ